MQMNVEFKEEQIGTPFVWVGALEGGGRGGGAKGGPIQKIHVTYNTFFFTLLVSPCKTSVVQEVQVSLFPATRFVSVCICVYEKHYKECLYMCVSVCVCVCVCECVCVWCARVCMKIITKGVYVCMCVCVSLLCNKVRVWCARVCMKIITKGVYVCVWMCVSVC